MNIEALDSEKGCEVEEKPKDIIERRPAKRILKKKAGTAKRNKDKVKRSTCSEEQTIVKQKSEDTMKLVENSNLCLFRSLRNKFGCNFCKMTYPEFSQLKEHSFTHKNPKLLDLKRLRGLSCKNADISDLKCNLCSEKCANLEYLQDHLKKEHDISFHGTEHYLVPYKFQDGYQCVICNLKFNTYMRLSVHMNSHYTYNVCETCGLSFINRSGLRTHVQAMHKEKKCSRCPAIFLTNSSKIKHLKQVHGIRPSKRSICNICNKTFKYTYILDEHKILEHGFKRPAVSTCEECGKTFLTPLKLKTHVRSVHIKERKYPCAKCDMRFFTTCDRRRHERTHEDVRSFCCSYCDAKFKSKDSWRRHLKRQHGHVFQNTVT
ncbi:hypothetical protein PYW07_013298 [Mythimna separata]|uniref:C2H2-type domain-containing protein n=1 Tax=Mythimna separata TaxID=271217 RepID=A0AAD8DK46_MYTSE|nr:hypothetical protein PYW07_013298 [Mythimna separata]